MLAGARARAAWILRPGRDLNGWSRYVASINSNVAERASAGGARHVCLRLLGPAMNAAARRRYRRTTPAPAVRLVLAPGTRARRRSAPVIRRERPDGRGASGRSTRRNRAGRVAPPGRARFAGGRHLPALSRFLRDAPRHGHRQGDRAQWHRVDLALSPNAAADATRTYTGLLWQLSYRRRPGFQSSRRTRWPGTDGNVDGEDRRSADDGHERRLPRVPRSRVRLRRPARWPRTQRHKMRLWGHGSCRCPRASAAPRWPRSALESGLAWSAVGNINRAPTSSTRVRHAADIGAVLLRSAGEYRTRHPVGHGSVESLVASPPRREEGAGVCAGRPGQHLQPLGGYWVNKTVLTRNDSAAYLASTVQRHARPRGALWIRVGFRPADQPVRLPGAREFSMAFGVRF